MWFPPPRCHWHTPLVISASLLALNANCMLMTPSFHLHPRSLLNSRLKIQFNITTGIGKSKPISKKLHSWYSQQNLLYPQPSPITFGKKLNPSFCSCQKPWESSLTLLSHPHIQSTRKSCWLYLQNTLSSHHLHRYHPSHHHFLPGSSQQSQDYLQHNSWSNLLKYINVTPLLKIPTTAAKSQSQSP